MTDVLAVQLTREGRDLVQTVSRLLGESRIRGVPELALRLPTTDAHALRIVATGAYNAGKSTLLRALTGLDIQIDADVATTSVTAYPWHGVELVDTPGVAAAHDHLHDEFAERAVGDADLVLFVLTGTFFDDVTVQHFRHVMFDLHKLPHTLVIINKKSQRAVSEEICRDAVARGIGRQDAHVPPVVRCDARDYLRAEAEEGERGEQRRRASGLYEVIEAVDALTRSAGPSGRLAKPYEAVLAAAADAEPLLEVSDQERSVEELLERRRTIFAESRVRLDSGLERELLSVHRSVVSAGEGVIASLTDGIPDTGAVAAFDAAVKDIAESLGGRVQREFERETARLEAEERALAAAPDVERLLHHYREFATPNAGSSRGGGLGDVWGVVQGPARDWLNEAVRSGGRPSSPMHTAVYEAGHALGHKFKPWQAVRVAQRLNFAITAATVVYDLYSSHRVQGELERQDAAAVAELRGRVVDVADGLVGEARAQLAPHVSEFYARLRSEDEELSTQLARAQADRAALRQGLDDLSRRARAGLLLLRQGPEAVGS